MSIYLWLDDMRKPPSHADSGVVWVWAKTHDEALEHLKTGRVVFASLDHDLADEHYQAFHKAMLEGGNVDTSTCKEKTGLDVMDWMREHEVWPGEGIRIHTMNTARKPVMINIVEAQYGRTFQYNIKGTHIV